MIISRISGGLGNQMFQYAAGRSLSLKLGVDLKLDLSYFRSGGAHIDRPLMLHHFNVITGVAEEDDIRAHEGAVCHQKNFEFSDEFSSCGDGTHLVGYWQSEKFFADVAEQIKEDFTFRDAAVLVNAQRFIAEMQSAHRAPGKLVSIHVRRGDYLDDGSKNQHPVMTSAYIVEAMGHFPDDSRFLMFSDTTEGIEWCKKNITGPNLHYCEGHDAIDDFAIMSRCDHNIIANSSFSWWAAWLNPNREKQIVAPYPSTWLGIDLADWNTQDLIPPSWITVGS